MTKLATFIIACLAFGTGSAISLLMTVPERPASVAVQSTLPKYQEGFSFTAPCQTHGTHTLTVVGSQATRLYELVDDMGMSQVALEPDIDFAVMMQDAFIIAPPTESPDDGEDDK